MAAVKQLLELFFLQKGQGRRSGYGPKGSLRKEGVGKRKADESQDQKLMQAELCWFVLSTTHDEQGIQQSQQ